MGISPGNISSAMPFRPDDVARRVRDLERDAQEQAVALVAAQTQIGSGGLLVNNGGSITIEGTGALNVGSGALNSAGSISAGTTITAAGNITGGGLISNGGISAAGGIGVGGAISGASCSLSGGLTAGGNVSASGQVISAGVINSPGTRANTVTVGYQSLWADSAGNFGANTSSRRYKQDITPVLTDTAGFLGLTSYKFRYKANVEALGDAAPWDYGLIAEEVVQVAPWACFFEDDGTTVKGINYDRLSVALLNVVQLQSTKLEAVEERLSALEAKA